MIKVECGSAWTDKSGLRNKFRRSFNVTLAISPIQEAASCRNAVGLRPGTFLLVSAHASGPHQPALQLLQGLALGFGVEECDHDKLNHSSGGEKYERRGRTHHRHHNR